MILMTTTLLMRENCLWGESLRRKFHFQRAFVWKIKLYRERAFQFRVRSPWKHKVTKVRLIGVDCKFVCFKLISWQLIDKKKLKTFCEISRDNWNLSTQKSLLFPNRFSLKIVHFFLFPTTLILIALFPPQQRVCKRGELEREKKFSTKLSACVHYITRVNFQWNFYTRKTKKRERKVSERAHTKNRRKVLITFSNWHQTHSSVCDYTTR